MVTFLHSSLQSIATKIISSQAPALFKSQPQDPTEVQTHHYGAGDSKQ